jgi:hypothetical protein
MLSVLLATVTDCTDTLAAVVWAAVCAFAGRADTEAGEAVEIGGGVIVAELMGALAAGDGLAPGTRVAWIPVADADCAAGVFGVVDTAAAAIGWVALGSLLMDLAVMLEFGVGAA